MKEPRHAVDYEDRGARAVRSVLLELGQVLGAYRDHFVVIGGAVPWILLPDADPPHVGTLDVDLSLDAEALVDQEYTCLVQALENAGYRRSEHGLKAFQLRRTVAIDGGSPIAVIVDLLMPREVVLQKNKPPLLAGFAVQRADGAAVAMRNFVEREFEGNMPDGRPNRVSLRIASIPALLVMKGHALVGRDKHKDAYDVYFSVRQYPGGPKALAQDCRPLLADPLAMRGFRHIAGKFTSPTAFGPETVVRFLRESPSVAGMTDEQVRMDAYGQVAAWLSALGIVADASA